MKKLLFLLFFFPFILYAQIVPVAPNTYGTVADLRMQAGTPIALVDVSGLLAVNDGNGGSYYWNTTSTITDDGFMVIKANAATTGRWMRIGNSNTLKGTAVLSGAALTTAYTVNYSTTLPFIPISVIVIPRTANAAVPSWVSTITNTGFTVNFTSIPVLGTNNIGIDFVVIKQ